MLKLFKNFYESLGVNKSQRFWRFFLILVTLLFFITSIILYGFHEDSININLGIKTENVDADK